VSTDGVPWLVVARTALVIVVALVLQVAVVSRLRWFGASPDLLLLVAAAAGLAGGPERGPMVGFAAGLALDVVLTTPFGLAALSYLLVGYSVSFLHDALLRATWSFQAATIALASGLGMTLFVAVGLVFGQTQFVSLRLIAIVVVVVVTNALMSVPAVHMMRWAFEGTFRESVEHSTGPRRTGW